ncbi:MAG TPA: DUF1573 domain-containing protein, partial [Ferruginibacter sp.]|nr:DUF1573 domain-containing protein [Ferruginibacter sp.]
TIDMGKLQQGTPTTAIFTVANIGNTPLIIEQANPTCGCTIGDYTKSPIAPGQNGEIKATYNAVGVPCCNLPISIVSDLNLPSSSAFFWA